MKLRSSACYTSCFVAAILCWVAISHSHANDNWPQFRGHAAGGIGSGSPPVSWDVESEENIVWKVRIPGLAHSAPIVWGNRIFVTTAVSHDTDDPDVKTGWLGGTGDSPEDAGKWTWQVLCLNRSTGETIWTQDAVEREPTIKRHLKATHANCTPATDGEFVVAFFGSEGLYCYDMDGNLIWEKDFGKLHSGPYNSDKLEWGFASSPVIYKDFVIVQCDCLNTGFVAVLDLESGKEIRRIEREDVATWSTPAVIEHDGKTQIVCNGYKQMASYDFESGDLLWTLSGGGDVPVPTPLYDDGVVFITNGHGRSPTFAISADAKGDVTPKSERKSEDKDESDEEESKSTDEDDALPDGLAWYQPRDGSYMPTPIIVEGKLYTCNDNGRLTVRDCKTGEEIYKQRVGGESGTYSASAVSAGGNLYFCNEAGKVFVVRAGDTYDQVAENDMKEVVMATPAVSGDYLLIRGVKHLYCIGKK